MSFIIFRDVVVSSSYIDYCFGLISFLLLLNIFCVLQESGIINHVKLCICIKVRRTCHANGFSSKRLVQICCNVYVECVWNEWPANKMQTKISSQHLINTYDTNNNNQKEIQQFSQEACRCLRILHEDSFIPYLVPILYSTINLLLRSYLLLIFVLLWNICDFFHFSNTFLLTCWIFLILFVKFFVNFF